MKIQTPAAQIAPQFAGNPQPRRLDAGDLADLTKSVGVKPAADTAARAQVAPLQTDVRPERPGSRLDIRV